MKKILLIFLTFILVLFSVSFLKKKSEEKALFQKQEQLIQETNNCLKQSDWICAEKNIRTLLKEEPNDTNLQLHLAGILLEQEKYTECKEYIATFSFNSETAKIIKQKAEQLLKESHELSSEDSRHFRVEFDSSPSKTDIYEALTVLEVAYDSLCRLFNFYPEERIHLVLYQSKEFQGSANRPEWVGAVFDGKLRVSLNVMQYRELYRPMLLHELTHAFVHSISRANIPLWLNEGIAQTVDGSSLEPFPQGNIPSIQTLRESFIKEKNTENAKKLYWYSLAMVKKILEKVPFENLKNIIQETGKNGIEKALEKYGLSETELLNEVSKMR